MKRDARNSVEGLGVPALRNRSADEDTGDADPQQHDHPDDDDAGDDEAVSWMPFDHYAIPVKPVRAAQWSKRLSVTSN